MAFGCKALLVEIPGWRLSGCVALRAVQVAKA